jgi:hypothetical protein
MCVCFSICSPNLCMHRHVCTKVHSHVLTPIHIHTCTQTPTCIHLPTHLHPPTHIHNHLSTHIHHCLCSLSLPYDSQSQADGARSDEWPIRRRHRCARAWLRVLLHQNTELSLWRPGVSAAGLLRITDQCALHVTREREESHLGDPSCLTERHLVHGDRH